MKKIIVILSLFSSMVWGQTIIISEIMYDPAEVTDKKGEWFEIYNATNADIDINGWEIKDDDNDTHTIDNGNTSLFVPADGFFVLGNNGDKSTNGGLDVDYVYGSDIDFGNVSDGIYLYDNNNNLIDKVIYDENDGWPKAGPGASMYFTQEANVDNNDGSNWAVSATPYGDGDTGSPGDKGEGELPVELTSFTATAIDKNIVLSWSTATEVNNYGFFVERSSTSLGTISDGGNNPSRAESRPSTDEWVEIGFVEGHGNSNSPKSYLFVDNSPIVGEASYRLKQIDIDGAFEYSDVVTVKSNKLAKYELYQNHPNPFNPSTVVSFSLPEMAHVKLTIYNAIGQEVTKLVDRKMEAGYHKVNFDGSNLSSGLYIYRLETPNYSKVKKMLLLR